MIHDNLLLSNKNIILLLHMDFLDKMVFFHFVVLFQEVHQIILMLMLDKIYILLHFDKLHLKDELYLLLLLLLYIPELQKILQHETEPLNYILHLVVFFELIPSNYKNRLNLHNEEKIYLLNLDHHINDLFYLYKLYYDDELYHVPHTLYLIKVLLNKNHPVL